MKTEEALKRVIDDNRQEDIHRLCEETGMLENVELYCTTIAQIALDQEVHELGMSFVFDLHSFLLTKSINGDKNSAKLLRHLTHIQEQLLSRKEYKCL
jgi:hypothetical protein